MKSGRRCVQYLSPGHDRIYPGHSWFSAANIFRSGAYLPCRLVFLEVGLHAEADLDLPLPTTIRDRTYPRPRTRWRRTGNRTSRGRAWAVPKVQFQTGTIRRGITRNDSLAGHDGRATDSCDRSRSVAVPKVESQSHGHRRQRAVIQDGWNQYQYQIINDELE